jgi:2-polyprenyl-6-methoxyphenol hydroxylase-like FAD-dependent oxidoreductase
MNVAVVGLGVAGGAVSLALARSGHRVTVFERAANPGPVGTGFLLQPSGRAALVKLGLEAEVVAKAYPIRRFVANKAQDSRLTELRMRAHGVARGVLFSALLGACRREGVTMQPGVIVADFSESDDAVTPRDGAGKRLGDFDLLVVADGARSALRAKLNPGYAMKVSPYGALWAMGRAGETCAEELRQETRGTRVLAGLLPVGERMQTFFWGLRATEFESLRKAGFPAFVKRVGAVFPEAVPVLHDIGGFNAMVFARYGYARAPRVFSNRTVLIGDAAHAMSPHLGQGANLALLDAVALADALGSHANQQDAFRAYARERDGQNAHYAGLSRLLGPFFQSDFDGLATLRDIALPIMGAVPPVRAMMESALAGERRGWF